MEVMGIRMLFNEHEPMARGDSRIYLLVLMTLISTELTTSRRLRQASPKMPFRYCYRTHRKFTSKPRQQNSISC